MPCTTAAPRPQMRRCRACGSDDEVALARPRQAPRRARACRPSLSSTKMISIATVGSAASSRSTRAATLSRSFLVGTTIDSSGTVAWSTGSVASSGCPLWERSPSSVIWRLVAKPHQIHALAPCSASSQGVIFLPRRGHLRRPEVPRHRLRRLCTPSFRRMCFTCVLTVSSDTISRACDRGVRLTLGKHRENLELAAGEVGLERRSPAARGAAPARRARQASRARSRAGSTRRRSPRST